MESSNNKRGVRMKLSEKIVMLRKQKRFSQEELAECLNVSRQTISRWELGTALPDATNIVQLSKLFDVSSDYLLNDDYKSDQDIPAVKHHKDFMMVFALQIMCFVFHMITCVNLSAFFPLTIISLVLNLFFARKLYEELQSYESLSELVKRYYIDVYVILIWFLTYISTLRWEWVWRIIQIDLGIGTDIMFNYFIELLLFIPIIKFTIIKIKQKK